MIYVFAHTALSPSEICGIIAHCDDPYNPFNQTWTLPVPSGKPPLKPVTLPPVSMLLLVHVCSAGLNDDCLAVELYLVA